MKNICPNCEKETNIKLINEQETIDIRGEQIVVDSEFYVCDECGEAFENTRDYDSLEVAYKEYRRIHNMLQPNEIKEWRKNYGLTQQELSHLLGWGGATLSRYENGALQDEAHDNLLRLAMEPQNLKKLIEKAPQAIDSVKQERLVSELSNAENDSCTFEIVFGERLAAYDPSEHSGFAKFSLQKLLNIILFFCKGGVLKTKLNKLLFYSDFKHFKEYSLSITGAYYIHLQYGPVPDNYEYYFAKLASDGKLSIDEIEVGNYFGDNCNACIEPDLSWFTASELKVIAEVKEYFNDFTSKGIKDYSHKETAYVETGLGEKITYKYAEHLSI